MVMAVSPICITEYGVKGMEQKLGDNRLHDINIEPHHIDEGMYQRYERV